MKTTRHIPFIYAALIVLTIGMAASFVTAMKNESSSFVEQSNTDLQTNKEYLKPLDIDHGNSIHSLGEGIYAIHGTISNKDSKSIDALISITFYDKAGVKMASGSAVENDISPNKDKDFRVFITVDVNEYYRYEVKAFRL